MFRTLGQVNWDDIEVGEVYVDIYQGNVCVCVKIKKHVEDDGAMGLADSTSNTLDVSGETFCGYGPETKLYRLPKSVQRLFYVPEVGV